MDDPTVLLTGAAGGVARMLYPGLDAADVRAVDIKEPHDGYAEVAVGDLANPAFAAGVVGGMDTVVHLAANPAPDASWDDLRAHNIEAVVNIVTSARDAGVRRVVLASSVHAMGGYFPGVDVVDPVWPVRPCCAYGSTKAFAEAFGHMTAATSDVSVVCLRLGACLPLPVDQSTIGAWLGPDDLQRLVRAAMDADVRAGTYFGVSANTRSGFDISNARTELGYEPFQDSETYAADLPPGQGGMCGVIHPPDPPAY